MTPQSQDELLTALYVIFPSFQSRWAEDTQDDMCASDSLHSVYQSFLPYFARANASQAELKRLATLINSAVSAGGNPENAVATCFLEGLGHGLERSLRPFLSVQARALVQA